MEVLPEKANKITQAIICLHNFCLEESSSEHQTEYRYITSDSVDRDVNGELIQGTWHENFNLNQIQPSRSKNATVLAKTNRDTMADFFITDGQVPWQWNMVR